MHNGCSRLCFKYCIAIVITIALSLSSSASIYSVNEDTSLFGWLDQYSLSPNGGTACVPTAATNALTFLQNTNPAYFGTSLTGNSYSSWVAADTVLMSPSYMDTTDSGTYFAAIPPALTQYITVDRGFNNISFSGIYPAAYWSDTYTKPSYISDGLPSSSFLFNALSTNQATIFSFYYDSGGGHEVTAAGFNWNDANEDGIIQQSENATISFIDPLDPSASYSDGSPSGLAKLTAGHVWNFQDISGGELTFSYNQYAGILPYIEGNYSPTVGTIDTIFSMSIPEPQTFALLAVALVSFLLMSRRRRIPSLDL